MHKPQTQQITRGLESASRNGFPPGLNPPQKMRHIHIRDAASIRVMWSPLHCTSLNSINPLSRPDDPRNTLTVRKWRARSEPLWWNCLSTRDISPRVVRSWANNRLRCAFRNALERKGYAWDGTRVAGEGDKGKERGQRQSGNLVGSAQLLTVPELVQTSWPQLEEQADKVLAELEKRTGSAPSRPVVQKTYAPKAYAQKPYRGKKG